MRMTMHFKVSLLPTPQHMPTATGIRGRRSSPVAASHGPLLPMARKQAAVLVWFRRDLRLTDHEPLHAAAVFEHCLPVYCLSYEQFATRWSGEHGTGLPKLGPHRCRFLLEAVGMLRGQLHKQQSTLIFRIGDPTCVMHELVSNLPLSCKHVALHYHQDTMQEAGDEEDRVGQAFQQAAVSRGLTAEVRSFWGLTLYHPDDLPFHGCSTQSLDRIAADMDRFAGVPSVMTSFRKEVQGSCAVRAVLPAPTQLPPLPPGFATDDPAGQPSPVPEGDIPSTVQDAYRQAGAVGALEALQALTGLDVASLAVCGSGRHDPRSAIPFTGGEEQGMERLRYYLWGQTQGQQGHSGQGTGAPPISNFAETRMLAGGVDSSAKLSAFLAHGCLSPRMVHREVMVARAAAAQLGIAEKECDWLEMHLCIRDFFVFTALKEGPRVMAAGGSRGVVPAWRSAPDLFTRWARGTTGLPFVDACMRELGATGYTSNRGRQNVASLLAKSLQLDWRLGAELFECLLVDHDAAINFANWNYFSGTGTDPRDRQFCTISQGIKYDEQAELIGMWLPELRRLPPPYRHQPFALSPEQAAQHGFTAGVDYGPPIVDPAEQIAAGPRKPRR